MKPQSHPQSRAEHFRGSPSLRRKAQGWGHSRAPRLFRVASLFAAGRGILAKYSVVFLIGARCEKQFGGEATIDVIPAEAQRPQPVDPQRIARLVQECAFELAADTVERMYVSIAEVADEQAMAEWAEVPRRLSNTPRRIEVGTMLQPQQEPS